MVAGVRNRGGWSPAALAYLAQVCQVLDELPESQQESGYANGIGKQPCVPRPVFRGRNGNTEEA